MLKKAIFDMDGLIFDSERLFMNCLKKAMAKRDYSLTDEIYINTLGLAKSDCEIYMKSVYGEDYPFAETSQEARDEIMAMAKDGLPVKNGIINLLEHLKSRRIECVIASSTQTKYIRSYLEGADILQYFSELIGGETVKKSKPEPDIFIKALGTEKKENAVIFEDSENGVIAATRAGIPVICIPDMKRPSDEVLKETLACVENAGDVIGLSASIVNSGS